MASIDRSDAVAARQAVHARDERDERRRRDRRRSTEEARTLPRERLEATAGRLREALARAGVSDLSVRIDLASEQLQIVRGHPPQLVRRIDIDSDEAERLVTAIASGAGLLVDRTL